MSQDYLHNAQGEEREAPGWARHGQESEKAEYRHVSQV